MAINNTTAGTIGSIGSGISALGAAYIQSTSLEIQQIQAKTAAKQAEIMGKSYALELSKRFNKTQATNAVVAAAQGRSGGSVNAIASAAQEQYNWDSMYSSISSGMTVRSMEEQASQYGAAAKTSLIGGALGSIQGTGQDIATNLYNIGGTTKKGKA